MFRLEKTTFPSNAGLIVWVVPGFTFVAVAATVVLALVFRPWREGFDWLWPPAWLLVALAAFSCLLLAASVSVVRRWRRYGPSTLEVSHYPDAARAVLAGTILAARAVGRQRRMVLTLSEKRITRGPAGGSGTRDTIETTVWKRTVQIDPSRAAVRDDRCAVAFEIEVPESPEPPDDGRPSRTYWMLLAQASGRSPKYFASFTLSEQRFMRLG